jgi:hypothetical protein
VFATLNLSGALVVYLTLERAPPAPTAPPRPSEMIRALADHLRNPPVVSAFAIGFLTLALRRRTAHLGGASSSHSSGLSATSILCWRGLRSASA